MTKTKKVVLFITQTLHPECISRTPQIKSNMKGIDKKYNVILIDPLKFLYQSNNKYSTEPLQLSQQKKQNEYIELQHNCPCTVLF